MARLYLVRHGEPTSRWGGHGDGDPGLTEMGHQQARATAERLRQLTPLQIVSSPLRRAIETAMPLSLITSVQTTIASEVAEIPSPLDVGSEQRLVWLQSILRSKWTQVDDVLTVWRRRLLDFLLKIPGDTAVFSHFVAINVVTGTAIGDERITCFSPTHASVTIFETHGPAISLVELGDSSATVVR